MLKGDGVLGAYDLALHQYGPEKIIGSIHIEVDDKLTAKDIHKLTRKISEDVFRKYGVVLTIGIYASNTDKSESAKIKQEVGRMIKKYETISQMHGFYADLEYKTVTFDLVFDFDEKNSEQIVSEISKKLEEKHPDYSFDIIVDLLY